MSTSAFLPVSAETLAVRGELCAGPGPEPRHALKALAALSDIADEDPVNAVDEVPPLPEDLRSRWHEAYGDELAAGPQPVRRAARCGEFEEWLAGLLRPRQLAWGGAFAVALLLGMLAVWHDWGTGDTETTRVITRGATHGSAPRGDSRPVHVIAPADGSEALMRRLAEAYPTRRIEHFASSKEADTAARQATGGVPVVLIVDVTARTLSVQMGGRIVKGFALEADSLTAPDTVITRIEDADEFLDQPGASAR